MRRLTCSLAAFVLSAAALPGCKPSNGPTPRAPSASDALGQSTCKAAQANTRPLLVEWPAADRAMLEAAANSGLVAVRYDGCELEVLSRCTLEGAYDYHALTHKRDEVRIRDEDALWTELPLGAARLEAALDREGQLNVDMAVVGRLEATAGQVRATPSASACDGATHMVTGMTVGAFAMYTGAALEARASATVGSPMRGQLGSLGGGGHLTRSREVLRHDGDFAACDAAALDADNAPHQCGALLRVELAPIAADGSVSSAGQQAQSNEADRLERAADRWHTTRKASAATAGVAAVGALAGIAVVGVRSVQISSAQFDRQMERDSQGGSFAVGDETAEIARLDAEIAQHKADRKVGVGVAIGLTLGATALAGFTGVARGRENKLRARSERLRDRTSVAPMLGRDFAGLTVAGRF